jgi:hypothetical protein
MPVLRKTGCGTQGRKPSGHRIKPERCDRRGGIISCLSGSLAKAASANRSGAFYSPDERVSACSASPDGSGHTARGFANWPFPPTAPAHFSLPKAQPPQRAHISVGQNMFPPWRTHFPPPETHSLPSANPFPSPESSPLHGGTPKPSPETHSPHGGTPFPPPEKPFLHGGMGSWNMWNA